MKTKTHTHLTLDERRRIYFLLGRKMPVVEIARQLNHHHSTIYREIRRNSFWDSEELNLEVNSTTFGREADHQQRINNVRNWVKSA